MFIFMGNLSSIMGFEGDSIDFLEVILDNGGMSISQMG